MDRRKKCGASAETVQCAEIPWILLRRREWILLCIQSLLWCAQLRVSHLAGGNPAQKVPNQNTVNESCACEATKQVKRRQSGGRVTRHFSVEIDKFQGADTVIMVESNTLTSDLVSLGMTLRRLKSAMPYNDDLSTGENLHVPARKVCPAGILQQRSEAEKMICR